MLVSGSRTPNTAADRDGPPITTAECPSLGASTADFARRLSGADAASGAARTPGGS